MKIWKIEIRLGWDTYIYVSNREPTEDELSELKERIGADRVFVDAIDVDGITYITDYDICP